jgi:hypothetical protein
MFIAVLVMYFTLLSRIRHLVETNRAYHEMTEKNNNCKNDIQNDKINGKNYKKQLTNIKNSKWNTK